MSFALLTLIQILLAATVIIGLFYEDELNKLEDKLAVIIGRAICVHRDRRRAAKRGMECVSSQQRKTVRTTTAASQAGARQHSRQNPAA